MKEIITSPVKPKVRLRINKRLYIILICILISSLFWLLIALSHDYPSMQTFPIRYVNLPGKKVVTNDLPAQIDVQLKASGFKILSWEFQGSRKAVQVDVAGNIQRQLSSADVLYFPTRAFLNDFSRDLGKEVTITGFKPDSIVFMFSDVVMKKVPVLPVYKVTFDKQFDSTGAPSVFPQEVIVTGPPSIVDTLTGVSTEEIVFHSLKSTAKKRVRLSEARLLSYNIEEVEFTLPVEKFTEGSVEIAVNPVNVTAGYSLKTFPDRIKVRYLVSLSRYNAIDESLFDAVVDASDLEKQPVTRLSVNIITKPAYARITMLEPEKVDYILKKQ